MIPWLVNVRITATGQMWICYRRKRLAANIFDDLGVTNWPTTHEAEGVGSCDMGQDVSVEDSVQANP